MTPSRPTESYDSLPTAIFNRFVASIESAFPTTIAELARLVKIPSVSWATFDAAQVQRSAEAVADLVRGLGVFDMVEIRRAPLGQSPADAASAADRNTGLGQPAVIARRHARNGRPTVLLYAHHDVQPPGEGDDWHSAPFEPTLRGDRLYGRGAADDKAGVMTHIGALRSLLDVVGEDLDLGIALFIEGEEEFGSRSFANFLRENRDDLAADAIVVADSSNWDIDTPALTVALRGNVTFRVTVSTLAHASHSGMFGGPIPDAMLATVRLLATLHDDNGGVAVAGLTAAELDTPAYDEAQFREESGLLGGVRMIGSGSILSRLWSQPAITVTGIDAPDVAHASNTLIPSVSVRISARIAPGQNAAEAAQALQQHLEVHAPFGAHIAIDDVDTGQPFLVDTSGWAIAESDAAMEQAWGRPPVHTGIGGSIPFIAELVAEFPKAQILVTGVEDPDSRAHSPNESLHLGVFKRAVLSEALLLARINARIGD